MMMQEPYDTRFTELLSEYAAPIADDGFSEAVLKAAAIEARRIKRMRRAAIYGGSFVGGIIAASQIPMLVSMVSKVNVRIPAIPEVASLPVPQWSAIGGLVLLGFVLWAVLDRQVSDNI